jgi:gliding motility-associated-like protein
MRYRYPGVSLLFVITSIFAFAQDFSNKGKEFWLSYSYHVGMGGGGSPTMTLYLTSDVTTNYNVEIFGVTVIQNGSITAGQVVSVDIPNSYFIHSEGLFTNRAIRVTGEKPLVVYSYITRSSASGATLCLPTNVLGREYYSVNFTQASNELNSNSYFNIIAVEDNTTVEITPSANTRNGWVANQTYTVNLNKGDIYQVLGLTPDASGVDLTGSKIKSVASGAGGCKKIAVFSGSGKIKIPATGCSSNSSDNLYQQLYPTGTWGKKYLTVPGKNNPFNYYRVIKADPSANVYVNGILVPASSFVNNQYYQFFNNTPNLIESDKPVSVAQYFTTQNCDGNSDNPNDPDMIMLNPVEQNIDKVTLVNSNLYAAVTPRYSHQHHIHVIMRNGGTGTSSFRLDGSPVPASSWTTHPADPAYSYLYLANVTQGYHKLASDSGFNALAYGYANAESYGYSAGANVKDLYQFVSIQNQYGSVNYPATCNKSPFYFAMTFPYQPTQIKWQFNGLFADVTINAPVFDSTWIVNGKQLYRYKLTSPYTITAAGIYPVKVLAQNPTTDGCSGEQEINYELQVYERPSASFNFTSSGCTPDSVRFLDNAATGTRPAVRWSWDFDDGTVSQLKNPAHLFTAAGNFDVKFAVITDIGCVSDTAVKTVLMNFAPAADFAISPLACVSKDVVFTNGSSANSGTITKWTWDLGEGNIQVKNSGAPFTYSYTTAKTYTVTLKVETDKGCVSAPLSKSLVVHELPVAGFKMPDNCLTDPFSQFTDTSSIADGTGTGFSYTWNFGDVNATAANPNTSTLKNPKHKYSQAGPYDVSLTVRSNNGCTTSLTQPFFVNGAQPKSLFTINGGTEHCSNTIVSITNNSTVDVGKVVRLEVQWDYLNNPADMETFIYPSAGTVYDHNYPEFFSPATKNYMIRVVAYSGDNCSQVSSQSVVVKATPQIRFEAIPPVCADAALFQIEQATVINGLSGLGVFTGKGVSASGSFDPQTAGAGQHTIGYTYTGTNGCVNDREQTLEVFPLPVISAGPDRFVLEGGSTVLLGSGSGTGLAYVWAPAQSLSNPSVVQPLSSPVNDIRYTLKGTSQDGCSASDEVLVKVLKTPQIPNTFSPNGDGIHDKWEVKYLESYPGATVEIYNRYGQLLFQSSGYTRPWDGMYKGSPLPAGTYYYIINPKNGRKQMAGFVDIIR